MAISISSDLSVSSQLPVSLQLPIAETIQPNWSELAVCISVVAIGILCSEVFLAGVVIETIEITLITIPLLFVKVFVRSQMQGRSTPNSYSFARSVEYCLAAPILEELAFRGVLLTTIKTLLVSIGFASASGLAVCISGTLFGIMHMEGHENDPGMAVFHMGTATFGGILYGAMTESIGIVSSIAAHMYFNTLLELIIYYLHQPPEQPLTTTISIPSTTNISI